MTDPTPINPERLARIAASAEVSGNAIVDRLRERLLEIVPRIAAETDAAACRAMIKEHTNRAGEELKALAAALGEQLAATEH